MYVIVIAMDFLNRCDDALMALLITIFLQLICMMIMAVTKRPIGNVPIIEALTRQMVQKLVDRLNRSGRSHFALMMRGTIIFFLLLATALFLFIGLEFVMGALSVSAYHHMVVLMMCLSPCAIIMTALQVSATQKTHTGFYRSLALAIHRNLVKSDRYAQRRAGGQALVTALTEWMMAPLVIYVAFGVPIFTLYIALSLFIRSVADDNSAFVAPFYWLYKTLQFVPSVILSLLLCVASIFTAGGNPMRALKGLKHWKSMPLATLAYAQNVILGGATQNLSGQKIPHDWVGPEGATAKLDHKDVIRLCIHCGITMFLTCVTLYVIIVLSGGYF